METVVHVLDRTAKFFVSLMQNELGCGEGLGGEVGALRKGVEVQGFISWLVHLAGTVRI